MSSNPERLQYLFQQYLQDTGTAEELREFWQLFSELNEDDNPVKKDLWELWYHSDTVNQPGSKDWNTTLQKIHTQAKEWEKKQTPFLQRISFLRIAAAALIIGMLVTGAYFLFSARAPKQIASTEKQPVQLKNDVPAGGSKAVLTLSNGARIILDSAPTGRLAQQGNSKIVKLDSGQLSYENQALSPLDKTQPIQYNTLATPRGGQYRLTLPDGTLVWLNSASTIHYPTAFPGKDRDVDITGEAYFEVAHKANQPFRVAVSGKTVEVMGTHFNINAYEDEPVMRTTLLEGSIRFTAGSETRVLAPGQQIQVQRDGRIKLIKNADVDQAVAWKNGLFSFQNTSIYEVMREVERWYDVDVIFKDRLDFNLNGVIEENVNVSKVFKMIELTGEAHFIIEGRKISVTK